MKILKSIIIAIISACISQLLCYFVIDDVFVYFATNNITFLCLRLFLAIAIYISINWAIKNPIRTIEKDMLFVSYILLAICISLLRFKLGIERPMNFSILKIIDYSKTTILFNVIFYIPVGYYAKCRLKIKTLFTFSAFLTYIVILELLQQFLKVGFFDINDIILNSFGFTMGFITKKFIQYLDPNRNINKNKTT